MIPPLAPGQNDESQNMVGWKNTFNMRQVTLMNLAASHLVLRGNNHSQQHALNCMQNGCITSPIKSLDILRKNIQNAINKDIDNVIKKYLEKFFQPAINNIRTNLGRESINDDHIKDACCKILEEAKQMYTNTTSNRSRDSSPYDYSDSETGSIIDYKLLRRPVTESPLYRKRKESDTDSEASTSMRKKLKSKLGSELQLRKLIMKRDSPKWNPERVQNNTLFIMGARANKVLGFGQKRGRLYVRHPDLVKYPSDSEDKEWLAQHNLMPPTRGKAYIMLYEDIHELTLSDDYQNQPELQLHELKGFEVPTFMQSKIKHYMTISQNQAKCLANELFDDSGSVSSKNSEMFVQTADLSPVSNHSFLSQTLSPSVSQQGVAKVHNTDSNHSTLSDLLAGHVASENSRDDF